MHACGHDIHTAILLGAAQLFKSMEAELPCMVKLFFQPAEETIGGAQVMVEGGCMLHPPVEQVLALHVDPTLPVGSVGFLCIRAVHHDLYHVRKTANLTETRPYGRVSVCTEVQSWFHLIFRKEC
jgi:metal-dependent amidase/aminoacylase/carboxypeptidase family protein